MASPGTSPQNTISIAASPSLSTSPQLQVGFEKHASHLSPSHPGTVQMYASWETAIGDPTAVSRLCSFQVTRLEILRGIDMDEAGSKKNQKTNVSLAISFLGSRRKLRTGSLRVVASQQQDFVLAYEIILQYSHYLKGEGVNHLCFSIQRRKRFKKPGYRTLCAGLVCLSDVLQGEVTSEVLLYPKGENNPMARITLKNMTTKPLTQKLDSGLLFAEEEILDYESEYGSDEEPEISSPRRFGGLRRIGRRIRLGRQKRTQTLDRPEPEELVEVIEEMEFLRDGSGESEENSDEGEPDPGVVGENSGSQIRAFYSAYFEPPSDRNLLAKQISSHSNTDDETPDETGKSPPGYRISDANIASWAELSSRHAQEHESSGSAASAGEMEDLEYDDRIPPFASQLSKVCDIDSKSIVAIMIDITNTSSKRFASELYSTRDPEVMRMQGHTLCSRRKQHIKSFFSAIIRRHTSSRLQSMYKVAIVGNDTFLLNCISAFTSVYSKVDVGLQSFVQFAIIPLSQDQAVPSKIARRHPQYSGLFFSEQWFDAVHRMTVDSKALRYVVSSILRYSQSEHHCLLDIGEALLVRSPSKPRDSVGEGWKQEYVPFVCSVRLGTSPLEDTSMNMLSATHGKDVKGGPVFDSEDVSEMQLEYWTVPDKKSKEAKSSIKATFPFLSISIASGVASKPVLNVEGFIKDRKGGIRQTVKGIIDKHKRAGGERGDFIKATATKLLGTDKSKNSLRVIIDGVPFDGVQFFSLTPVWASSTKKIPLLLPGGGMHQRSSSDVDAHLSASSPQEERTPRKVTVDL
eukprot:m.57546 g.57546  ORF g.57546 m.57546 type:complete len:802 (+) comp11115_c0_seq1:219-2624(+)